MTVTETHQLVDKWKSCSIESPPFIFPGDEVLLDGSLRKRVSFFSTFQDYIGSKTFGLPTDQTLHLGLLPVPYVGNLQRASVFILMLNPGFSPGDYYAEQYSAEYREVLERNLRQENGSDRYPFFALDPRFAWHPGFQYWHRRLQGLARALALKDDIDYQDALAVLAKHIACLEYVPYHSKSFGLPTSVQTKLASVRSMTEYVHEYLVPRARIGQATIIVTRSSKAWGMPQHENIVVYEGGETRFASLSLNSRGGSAIAATLGLNNSDRISGKAS